MWSILGLINIFIQDLLRYRDECSENAVEARRIFDTMHRKLCAAVEHATQQSSVVLVRTHNLYAGLKHGTQQISKPARIFIKNHVEVSAKDVTKAIFDQLEGPYRLARGYNKHSKAASEVCDKLAKTMTASQIKEEQKYQKSINPRMYKAWLNSDARKYELGNNTMLIQEGNRRLAKIMLK